MSYCVLFELPELSKDSSEIRITCTSTQITNIGSTTVDAKIPDVVTVTTLVTSTLESISHDKSNVTALEIADSQKMPHRLTKSCQDLKILKGKQ